MFDKKSKYLEIMGICNKIFKMSFQCKIKDREIIIPSNRKHSNHFFLLFAIPGIITIALASITGNPKYLTLINEIKEILNSETDFNIIYKRLLNLLSSESILLFDDSIERLSAGMEFDDLKKIIYGPIPDGISDELFEFMRTSIVPDELKSWVKTDLVSQTIIEKILQFESNYDFGGYDALIDSEKKMSRHFPPGIVALFILLNYKNLSFYESSNSHNFQPVNWSLIFAFGNYYILASMIYGNIVLDRECVALSKLEVAFMELLYDVKIGQFNHYNIFSMLTESYAKGMVADSIKKTDIYCHQRTITVITSGLKIFLHEYLHEKEVFYVLSQTSNIKSEFNTNDDELIGVAVNTTIFIGVDFKLILIAKINDSYKPTYEHLEETYLLVKNQMATAKNNLSVMANRLYQIVQRCAAYSVSIMSSWQALIDRPRDKIGPDIDSFEKLVISVLTECHEEREELLRAIALSLMIGNIDTEIEGTDELRKLYKKAKIHHISPELRQKLLEAASELELFINDVVRKRKRGTDRLGDHDTLLKYIKNRKKDYRYLKLLENIDIERIDFTKGGTSLRDNRRRILPLIYKKMTGKDINNSELTKKLGFESGEEEYLKLFYRGIAKIKLDKR